MLAVLKDFPLIERLLVLFYLSCEEARRRRLNRNLNVELDRRGRHWVTQKNGLIVFVKVIVVHIVNFRLRKLLEMRCCKMRGGQVQQLKRTAVKSGSN